MTKSERAIKRMTKPTADPGPIPEPAIKPKRRPGKTTVQLDDSTVAELRRQALPGEVLEDAVRRLAGMAPVARKHPAWSKYQKTQNQIPG